LICSVETLERGYDFAFGVLQDEDQQAGAEEDRGAIRGREGKADERVCQKERKGSQGFSINFLYYNETLFICTAFYFFIFLK
jgi:hypothetical protein